MTISCRKNSFSLVTPQTLPVANGQPVTVTINQNQPGNTIPANFEGLSYEIGRLTNEPTF